MEHDNLYTIIKSLTKTEKAYFKKFASRHILGKQNKYVVLFDAIASGSNGYDEMEIKKKFQNEKFVKNFPVIKRYLFSMILKSLNSFYSASSPDNEIKNQVRHIEILYKKGLFESCSKILNGSLKLAYRTDNFMAILELLRWKKNLINEGVYKGNEFAILEKAHREEKEVISKISNLSNYRLISYHARSLAKGTNPNLTGENIRKELLNILNNPLFMSDKKALSFPATITYYHVLALVYESLSKNFEALECRKQLIRIMESHPETLKINITNYIVSVYNILGTCLNLKYFNELGYYIKKLRTIEKTSPGKVSKNDRLLIFMGSSIFELRMHISRGEFSESCKNLIEIEDGLEQFNKTIVKADKLQCFYLLGYGYFGVGKINEALKWINEILNDNDANQDSKLYIKSRIINLIIHYELGNFELLDYLIKSTYRFLKKNKFSGHDEKIVIEFLKRLPDISSQNQLLNLFTESLEQLKIPQQNNLINSLEFKPVSKFEIQNSFTNSAEFDLVSWLESKISGSRFEDMVKAKYELFLALY